MTYTRRYWTGFIYFISVLSLLVVRILFAGGMFSSLSSASSSRVWTYIVQTVCMGIIPLVGFLILARSEGRRRPLATFVRQFGYATKVSRENWLRTLLIGFLVPFTATFVAVAWNGALSIFGYKSASTVPTDYSTIGLLVLEIVMTAVYPAIFEELTHRGLLFAGYKNREYGLRVVFLTAILFALMHQNVRQTGYTFYDGIILGLLVYYTGSIYPAMLVHFMNNLFSVLSEYAAAEGGIYKVINIMYSALQSNAYGMVLFFVLFVLGLYFLFELLRGMKKSCSKKHMITIADVSIYVDKDFNIVQDLYGQKPKKQRWQEDIWLYGAIFMGVVSTIYTLVWGILR